MTTFADLKAECDWLAAHFSHAPGNDNVNDIWAELEPGLQGESYCAAGVSWEWKHAGRPLPAIDRPYGYINCADARAWAKRNGMWSESGRYTPGDALILFGAEHTETVISDDGVNVHTFGCNTSSGVGGSQSNGGGCYYRIRAHGSQIDGAVTFSRYFDGKPTSGPVPQPTQLGKLPLQVDGVPGLQTYAALQRVCGAIVDGEPGRDTWIHVQRRVHVAEDGDPGPVTWRAIQKHTSNPHVDGTPGPETWTYVQRSLNARKF